MILFLMVEIYAKKYSGKIFGITREAEVSVVSQTVKTSTVRHPELVSGSLKKTQGTSKRFRNKLCKIIFHLQKCWQTLPKF